MPPKRKTESVRRRAELQRQIEAPHTPAQIEGPPQHARIEGLYAPKITGPPTKVKDIKTGTLRGTVISVLSRHHTNSNEHMKSHLA